MQKGKRKTGRGVTDRIRILTSLVEGDKACLPHAIGRYLTDRSPKVRAFAIDLVREESLSEMEEQVLSLLSDKNTCVRYSAIECLGSLHEGEAIEAPWLYPFLQDTVPLVRIETLESLAQIGDWKALPQIAEKLQDEDALVRAYAAISIAELEGKEYVAVIENASRTERNDRARVGFAEALFDLGDEGQFSILLELLSSSDYRVRCASANALSYAELTPAQVQSAPKKVSFAARHSLGRADKSTMERVKKELREQQ